MDRRHVGMLLTVCDLHLEFVGFDGIAKVLDGVSLRVKAGEKVGLVGESGCGKTVTMKSILGILASPPARVTRGSILYKEWDILKVRKRGLPRVHGGGMSYVPQDPMSSLNPVFTIGTQMRDVLKYADAKLTGRRGKRSRLVAVEALARVQLADPERLLKSYAFQLSGGMQQRVLIAMGLLSHPELVIADEPGTALDVTIQAQILEMLDALVQEEGLALLIITHNLGVVNTLVDWVYTMYAGSIVEEGPTAGVFAGPAHPYTKALIACVPKLAGGGIGRGIPGRVPSYFAAPSGCRFGPRCVCAFDTCGLRKPEMTGVREGPGHSAACFLLEQDRTA